MPEVKRKRKENLFAQSQFAKGSGLSEYGKNAKKTKKSGKDHDISLTNITNLKLDL